MSIWWNPRSILSQSLFWGLVSNGQLSMDPGQILPYFSSCRASWALHFVWTFPLAALMKNSPGHFKWMLELAKAVTFHCPWQTSPRTLAPLHSGGRYLWHRWWYGSWAQSIVTQREQPVIGLRMSWTLGVVQVPMSPSPLRLRSSFGATFQLITLAWATCVGRTGSSFLAWTKVGRMCASCKNPRTKPVMLLHPLPPVSSLF